MQDSVASYKREEGFTLKSIFSVDLLIDFQKYKKVL